MVYDATQLGIATFNKLFIFRVNQNRSRQVDRRSFMAFASDLAGTAVASNLMAKEDHSRHEMVKKRVWSKTEKDLLTATAECESVGKICVSHCFDLISAGKTDMLACQKAVMNMLAVVEALHTTVSYGSASRSNLIMLTKACKSFCQLCKEECDKHAKHHSACKECAISCDKCVKACNTYLKA